jgi:hypothetical protein
MLNKAMQKSVMVMMLVFGILLTTAAPSALAGDKRCKRGSNYYTSNYNDDYYDRDQRRRQNRDYEYNDDYYRRDRRNGASREVLRDVGIGAAVGAGGGVLLGGKKGALIGAAIGAAGGYVYNRGKKNRW